MIGINRGFQAMIPQKEEQEPIYDFKISFTLFRRVYSISINVKPKEDV
jgi:hypothetical protein